jgi:hypothetical protein
MDNDQIALELLFDIVVSNMNLYAHNFSSIMNMLLLGNKKNSWFYLGVL